MIEATAWGQQPGFLIRDRDRSYGGDFIARARRIGIETDRGLWVAGTDLSARIACAPCAGALLVRVGYAYPAGHGTADGASDRRPVR